MRERVPYACIFNRDGAKESGRGKSKYPETIFEMRLMTNAA